MWSNVSYCERKTKTAGSLLVVEVIVVVVVLPVVDVDVDEDVCTVTGWMDIGPPWRASCIRAGSAAALNVTRS